MRRLVCAFVVCKPQRQVFSSRPPFRINQIFAPNRDINQLQISFKHCYSSEAAKQSTTYKIRYKNEVVTGTKQCRMQCLNIIRQTCIWFNLQLFLLPKNNQGLEHATILDNISADTGGIHCKPCCLPPSVPLLACQ